MSARESSEPANFNQYRERRAQQETLPPGAVRAILNGQPDPEVVGAAYAGNDASIIRYHAERLGISPGEFISRSVVHVIMNQQLHEQGFEFIVRLVPPHLRPAQTAMDDTLRNEGGAIQFFSVTSPEDMA